MAFVFKSIDKLFSDVVLSQQSKTEHFFANENLKRKPPNIKFCILHCQAKDGLTKQRLKNKSRFMALNN